MMLSLCHWPSLTHFPNSTIIVVPYNSTCRANGTKLLRGHETEFALYKFFDTSYYGNKNQEYPCSWIFISMHWNIFHSYNLILIQFCFQSAISHEINQKHAILYAKCYKKAFSIYWYLWLFVPLIWFRIRFQKKYFPYFYIFLM